MRQMSRAFTRAVFTVRKSWPLYSTTISNEVECNETSTLQSGCRPCMRVVSTCNRRPLLSNQAPVLAAFLSQSDKIQPTRLLKIRFACVRKKKLSIQEFRFRSVPPGFPQQHESVWLPSDTGTRHAWKLQRQSRYDFFFIRSIRLMMPNRGEP